MSFLSRLLRSAEQADADELRDRALTSGCTSIATVGDRDQVQVMGVIRAVTLPPKSTVPALVAEIYDGTGSLHVVWLGRREIHGIRPGARIRVRGRVTYRKGSPTIFNPVYELVPHGV